MELNEVFRRVVLRHKRLIAFCVVVGVAVPVALALTADETYTAATRLVVATDPGDPEASAAIADGAKAVVTSPDHVADAFLETGVDGGDPLRYAQEHVGVRALGTSSVLELTVTDADPNAAAAMANALAEDLIRTRKRASSDIEQAINGPDGLQQKVDELTTRIDTIQQEVVELERQIASARASGDDARATILEEQRQEAGTKRDLIAAERLTYESRVSDLKVQLATQPQPRVINGAAVPAAPDAKNVLTDGAVGGLLGLLIGLGIASAREMLHPTVAGGDAIARAFGTRPLGSVRRVRGRWAPLKEDHPVVVRLRLAAQSAGAETVEVVGVPAGLDPAAFAYRLQDAIPGAARRGQARGGLVVRAFGSEVTSDASSNPVALVLSERAVSLRDVESLRDLLALAERPVIGVIVAEGRRRGGSKTAHGGDPTPRTKVIELPSSEMVTREDSEDAIVSEAAAAFESAPPQAAPEGATSERASAGSNVETTQAPPRGRNSRKRAARRAARASNGTQNGFSAVPESTNRPNAPRTSDVESTPAAVSSSAAARAAAAVGGRQSAAVSKAVTANGASTNGKPTPTSDGGDASNTAADHRSDEGRGN